MQTALPNQATEGKTVLIVDDEPAIRALLRDALVKLPVRCRIFEAENGEQAINLARTTRMDLVLLDIILPGSSMQGVMICRELCQDMHSKVVIVSGAASSAITDACLSMGAAEIIHKPFSIVQLSSQITQWLTGSSHQLQ